MKRVGELASEYVKQSVWGGWVSMYVCNSADRQAVNWGVGSREERVSELVSKQGIKVLRKLVNGLIEELNKKV